MQSAPPLALHPVSPSPSSRFSPPMQFLIILNVIQIVIVVSFSLRIFYNHFNLKILPRHSCQMYLIPGHGLNQGSKVLREQIFSFLFLLKFVREKLEKQPIFPISNMRKKLRKWWMLTFSICAWKTLKITDVSFFPICANARNRNSPLLLSAPPFF